ncbi:MAG TPA: hypothetical protein VHB77_05615 [Planctomycetaceae bacterium]|nr:hypothetical protein [Planctomycetaceae bacterium]
MFWHEYDLLHGLRNCPEVLARAETVTGSELAAQQTLRREFPDELVRAALTLVDLRRKARAKFDDADRLWLDRQGLEQATADPVARHKAQRFSGLTWDYCSGIGSDARALAARGTCIAVDANPAQCLRAKWNAEANPPAARPINVCAKVEQLTDRSGLLHIDPDRRPGGSARVVRIEDYVPGLEFLERMTQEFAGGAIKLSPASNFGGKFPQAEVELISLNGECKEATIWFGSLTGPHLWRATVLPSGETIAGHPLDEVADVRPLGSFIFDPDPAVTRAGLLDVTAVRLQLGRLDGEEEYLTGDSPCPSPFVQGFEVLAELPNNPRAIRNWFRTSDIGQIEIKCRRIPVAIDTLRRQIPLPGDMPGVLIFARLAGKARAVVCRRAE